MIDTIKLTPVQKRLLDAMEYDRWYDAILDGLPVANGRTYQALIRYGLIEARRTGNLRVGTYEPMKWTHKFKKINIENENK